MPKQMKPPHAFANCTIPTYLLPNHALPPTPQHFHLYFYFSAVNLNIIYRSILLIIILFLHIIN